MGKNDKKIYTSVVGHVHRVGLSKSVASILGVELGDKVQFVLTTEGRVVIEKASE